MLLVGTAEAVSHSNERLYVQHKAPGVNRYFIGRREKRSGECHLDQEEHHFSRAPRQCFHHMISS